MKSRQKARVISQTEISPNIYDLFLAPTDAVKAEAGQFVALYPKNASTLLMRPISICEQTEEGYLRLVYRILGSGTKEFSHLTAGDEIDFLGILGNGFPTDLRGQKVTLMAGGIGVPPMLGTMKALHKNNDTNVILGYRNADLFLKKDFEQYGEVIVATEDGSCGVKGNVVDALKLQKEQPDVIMACGPMPMLAAIKRYAEENGITAYISLEERMACGVGACLGCVTKTKNVDHHSQVKNARVCTEGPVFNAEEVDI